MVRFTLTTGLRVSNVLLEPEWQQIDMQRRVARIHPDQKAIGVPLNDDAVAIHT